MISLQILIKCLELLKFSFKIFSLLLKATGGVGISVDIELVRVFHLLNKDKKELYVLLKYSDDGKKIVLAEKGPLKKKSAKNYAEKSIHLKVNQILCKVTYIF